jgi:hypothetical protein
MLIVLKAIQEELRHLYSSFFTEMEYAAYLTRTVLFDVALPVIWASYVLPAFSNDMLRQKHTSTESSLSGACSSSSSIEPQNTVSPTTHSSADVRSRRRESSIDDMVLASELAQLHIEVGKNKEEPNLEITQFEKVILNSENGKEWFDR